MLKRHPTIGRISVIVGGKGCSGRGGWSLRRRGRTDYFQTPIREDKSLEKEGAFFIQPREEKSISRGRRDKGEEKKSPVVKEGGAVLSPASERGIERRGKKEKSRPCRHSRGKKEVAPAIYGKKTVTY